jgi:glycosyltransferase involved in cell wall biosynthesis
MTNLKISIITPCLDSGHSIKEALESVKYQGYNNYEHIIVDGGSKDSTKAIVSKYDNIIWISEPDHGQSDAMNKGFKLTTGDIIVYLNADDYFLADAFNSVIPYFENRHKVVMGNVLVKNDNGNGEWLNLPKCTFGEMIRHWEKDAFCVNPVGYFYKKEVQNKIPFNINNHDSMDLEFLLNVSLNYEIKKIEKIFGVFNYTTDCKTKRFQSDESYWQPDTWPYINPLAKRYMSEVDYLKFLEDRDLGYSERNMLIEKENKKISKSYKLQFQTSKEKDINHQFSIIIPTFNVEKTIRLAIESIIKQTIDIYEIIIIDGASTDNTCAIVTEYQQKHKNIILVSEPDNGIYDAMNKGIEQSSGNWLFFMGADDVLYNETVLQELVESGVFDKNQVVYGNVLIKGNNDWAKDQQLYDGKFDLNKLLQKNICQQAMFYPRRVFIEYGMFDLKFPVSSDWVFNLKIFSKEPFVYTDQTIAIFATGGKSTTDKTSDSYFLLNQEFIDSLQIDFSDPSVFDKTSPFSHVVSNYIRFRFDQSPLNNQIKEGISVISAIKNRAEHFEQSLQTWLSHSQVNEIVVVDWSSDEPISPIIEKYQDGRIKLVEVKGQSKWNLAMAYNLATRFTTFDKIVKTDADIELLPGFFDRAYAS